MTPQQEEKIISACRHRDTDRLGLYIMVVICMLNSCDIVSKEEIRGQIDEALTDYRAELTQEKADELTSENNDQ